MTILIALAFIAIVFGGWRLVAPVSFYAFNGLDLPRQPGLLSEVRGVGGIMLFAGVIVAAGGMSPAWTRTALVVAFVLYGGIVLGAASRPRRGRLSGLRGRDRHGDRVDVDDRGGVGSAPKAILNVQGLESLPTQSALHAADVLRKRSANDSNACVVRW